MIIFSAHLNPLCPFLFSTQRSLSFLPFTHLRETALFSCPSLKPSLRAPGHTCLWSPPPASRGAGPCPTPGRTLRRRDPCSSRQTLPSRLRSAPTPKPPRAGSARWASAPLSLVQLDLFLRAADLSPRSCLPWGVQAGQACSGPQGARGPRPAGGAPPPPGLRTRPAASLTAAARARRQTKADNDPSAAPARAARTTTPRRLRVSLSGGWAAPRRPRLPRALWET